MELFDKVAYKTSQMVTETYSTSFSKAVAMLPPEIRIDIYNIYGFVRFADEIVDSFFDHNQEKLLDHFERDLNEALEINFSMNPVLHAFAQTVNRNDIPRNYIEAFMKSMRADLHKTNYLSNAETEEYIYGSAEVVGLMCLKVFVKGDSKLYEELILPARKLGSAFQKVNFLRDLKSDYEDLNRTYFAEFKIESFDEAMKQSLIKEIEDEFVEAKIGIDKLPRESKIAVLIAYTYYSQLLRKLKRTPANEILDARIRVKDSQKFILMMKTFFIYKLNLI